MNVTIYTGAGISSESGVPLFRGGNSALWDKYDMSVVSTADGWKQDCLAYTSFWREAERQLLSGQYKPNKAHRIIAEWEKSIKGFKLITTNVDTLHEEAGSTDPIKIHGDISKKGQTIHCRDGSKYTCPDVVLFGHQKKRQDEMWKAIAQADLFVVVGSSLSIAGDSTIIFNAKDQGARTVEINPYPTGHPAFDMVIPKSASIGLHELRGILF